VISIGAYTAGKSLFLYRETTIDVPRYDLSLRRGVETRSVDYRRPIFCDRSAEAIAVGSTEGAVADTPPCTERQITNL
jgi:hypothetical protein